MLRPGDFCLRLSAGKTRLSRVPEYQVDNDANMQVKDRRPNRHKGAPTYSWRKNRGKKGGFCGGAPGRDAWLRPPGEIFTSACPKYAILLATRAKLRAKNGRDVLHRSHLKQIECAQGFDDDVCQGTMPCVEVR